MRPFPLQIAYRHESEVDVGIDASGVYLQTFLDLKRNAIIAGVEVFGGVDYRVIVHGARTRFRNKPFGEHLLHLVATPPA